MNKSDGPDELPELPIREMTNEEVQAVITAQTQAEGTITDDDREWSNDNAAFGGTEGGGEEDLVTEDDGLSVDVTEIHASVPAQAGGTVKHRPPDVRWL